jgi:hypothetical protein
MMGGCCCGGVAGAGGAAEAPVGTPPGLPFGPAPATQLARRGWDLAAGALSLGVWAFMPKCPMCVAAYVAVWTGLGLSLAAATYLRWSLLIASAAVLVYIVLKRNPPALAIRRFFASRDTKPRR